MYCSWRSTINILILVHLITLLDQVWTKSKCDLSPRPPPPGCCPSKYAASCVKSVPICRVANALSNLTAKQGSTFINRALPRHPCGRPWKTAACQGGFYLNKANPLNVTVEACPQGFFCPELQTDIVPCPLGAYCVEMKMRKMKKPKLSTKICETIGACCYSGYKSDIAPLLMIDAGKYVCPGMSSPDPCPKGNYCPNTTTKITCTEGHYCQQGSVTPKKCPLLTNCGRGESAPLKNAAGPLLAVLLVAVFIGAYYAFEYRKSLKFMVCKLFPNRKKDAAFGMSFNIEKGLKGVVTRLVTVGEEEKRGRIIPKKFTMDITFEDLSLTLKTHEQKKVLSGVTGCIKSGEVTAVMGPSGAGKTTFLNALSGKAYYGTLGGTIMVNNDPVSDIKKYRRITGFVPQEDVMHRQLTVNEVLTYQAKLRLPTTVSKDYISTKVKQTLELLDISHVMDSKIGDEETRGISGGQRKRVNIGMELVADPTLLFLDEPTSGLDSTSSLSVLGALRAVAEKGRLTVICVIHQPRYEIFSLFHNILFLGPGGRTVYQGDVESAESYFNSLGYVCPDKVNPADFYMDVIGGVYKKDEEDGVDALFSRWEEKETVDSSNIEEKAPTSNNDDFVARAMPWVHQQFWTFLLREIHLQFRYMKSLFMDLFLVLIAGGMLGGLYAEVKLGKVIAMNTSSSLAIGLTAMLSSLRCFGNHRTTFWRESASGVNTFSYFMAVNVCQLPIILLTPLVYLSLQYTFTSPRALFIYHYLTVLMAQFACSGMGYAISCILNPRNSQMASVVIVLISSLLSGTMPDLCQLNKFTFVGPFMYTLSYSRWFVEALYEKEAARYPDVLRTLVDAIAYRNDYSLDNFGFCLFVLFLFGIAFRAMAYLFLIFTNRGKQK